MHINAIGHEAFTYPIYSPRFLSTYHCSREQSSVGSSLLRTFIHRGSEYIHHDQLPYANNGRLWGGCQGMDEDVQEYWLSMRSTQINSSHTWWQLTAKNAFIFTCNKQDFRVVNPKPVDFSAVANQKPLLNAGLPGSLKSMEISTFIWVTCSLMRLAILLHLTSLSQPRLQWIT